MVDRTKSFSPDVRSKLATRYAPIVQRQILVTHLLSAAEGMTVSGTLEHARGDAPPIGAKKETGGSLTITADLQQVASELNAPQKQHLADLRGLYRAAVPIAEVRGIHLSLEEASVDRGDWPFSMQFGLAYPGLEEAVTSAPTITGRE